jgi:hypothetical protein
MVLGYARELAPGAQLVRLSCAPVVGAVLLAIDAAGGGDAPAARERLVAEG